MTKDDVVGRGAIDNKEGEQLGGLPRVLADCDEEIDGANGGHPVTSETDQGGLERGQTFFPDLELAEAVEENDV